ncbi:MAG: GYD domain-containing protein [Nitrospirae bacterium]|nr:GYD domain-containing protein [Nitrospirota bacterium]
MKGKYSSEAIKQISGKRTTKATDIVKKCGGKIVAVYATMGDTDLLAITEFPSLNEAIKASIALNKALGISFSTVPAITVEDFDKLASGK